MSGACPANPTALIKPPFGSVFRGMPGEPRGPRETPLGQELQTCKAGWHRVLPSPCMWGPRWDGMCRWGWISACQAQSIGACPGTLIVLHGVASLAAYAHAVCGNDVLQRNAQQCTYSVVANCSMSGARMGGGLGTNAPKQGPYT